MRKRTKKLIFIYSGIAVLFIAILCVFIFIGRKKIYTLNYYVNGELYKTVETDTYEPIEVEGIPDDKYFLGWFSGSINYSVNDKLLEPIKLKKNMDVYAYVAGIDFYILSLSYLNYLPTEESIIHLNSNNQSSYTVIKNINNGNITFYLNKFTYSFYEDKKILKTEYLDGKETEFYKYEDISTFKISYDTNMNMKVSLLSIYNPEILETDEKKNYNYKEKTADININYESNDYFIIDAEKIFTKDELVLLDYLLKDYINSFNNFDFNYTSHEQNLKNYYGLNIK